jgi:flagellar biosynthesis protein FlhB
MLNCIFFYFIIQNFILFLLLKEKDITLFCIKVNIGINTENKIYSQIGDCNLGKIILHFIIIFIIKYNIYSANLQIFIKNIFAYKLHSPYYFSL